MSGNVKYVGDYAFAYCDNLRNVEIESHRTQLGNSVFEGCKKIPFPLLTMDNKKLIKESSSLEGHYSLNANIQYIENNAFENCRKITSIYIPSSVISIGSNAFAGCANLQDINIPNTVDSIRTKCFSKCTGLGHIDIPGSIVSIGDSAFYGCDKLEKLYIPKSVNRIGIGALDCGVTELSIPFLGPSRTSSRSEDAHYESLYVPCLCIFSIDKEYSGGKWNDYGWYIETYSCHCHFPKTLKKLILTDLYQCPNGEFQTHINIHNYYNNGKGKSIYYSYKNQYSASIDSIIINDLFGEYQPYEHGLTREQRAICTSAQNLIIKTSSNNITLGAKAFDGLFNLKKLTLPFPGSGTKDNTGSFASLFGTTATNNMKKIGSYYLPIELKEVIISEGCEQIPAYAFKECSMIEKLTFPTTVKSIKEEALYGCDGLTDIYMKRALPPSAYESTFTGINQFGCTLHVPYDSKKYYSIATGWKYFYFIEEEAPIAINVTKNIENAGEILGLKQYQPGQTAELEAIAHSGYKFAAWAIDGTIISTDSKYSFVITDKCELIAVFVPVNNENTVQVTPGPGKVNFTWTAEESANHYALNIYSDESKNNLIQSYEFDAEGRIITRSNQSDFSAEISSLPISKNYYYSLTAYAENNITLSQYTGTFSILTDRIEPTMQNNIKCYSISGGIEIQDTNGNTISIFNIQGKCVYSRRITKTGSEIIPLPSGLYIVKAGNYTTKCAVK